MSSFCVELFTVNGPSDALAAVSLGRVSPLNDWVRMDRSPPSESVTFTVALKKVGSVL